MYKLLSIVIVVMMGTGCLSGCGSYELAKSATDHQAVINGAQDSVKATIGQRFMTIKTEDGTAYTWDKGVERNELQDKIDTMLTSLIVRKAGMKERPSPFVAVLFQKTSVIIPYGVSHPEKHILIENEKGTFIGECPAEDLNAVLKWLRDHQMKIVP